MSIHAANLKLRDELFTAKQTIQRVRDLHKRLDSKQWHHAGDCVERDAQWQWRKTWQCKPECAWRDVAKCDGCPYHPDYGMEPWPCDTIKALDGGQ